MLGNKQCVFKFLVHHSTLEEFFEVFSHLTLNKSGGSCESLRRVVKFVERLQ